ncbi:MAG: flagellar protein FlaG [Rhodocyclales bacterium]|nr:flagellar protein FlaG [Rhodocyclales bacterium]
MGINQVSGQATAYVAPDVPQRPQPAHVPDSGTAPALLGSQPAPGQTAGTQVSRQELEETLQRVSESLKSVASNNLEFSIDDTTGKTVVRVVDSSTKELIRQIPTEEMLAIARAIDGEIKGLLVRNQA